jgi:hypothetical protein
VTHVPVPGTTGTGILSQQAILIRMTRRRGRHGCWRFDWLEPGFDQSANSNPVASMITRYFLLALGLLLVSIPLHAQTTWESAQRGAEGAYLTSVYRTRSGALLGGRFGGVVRFDPDTRRWSEPIVSGDYVYTWTFAADSTGAIYAASSGPIYRSTDDGRSWEVIETGGAMVVSLEERVVLITGTKGNSTDGGATWRPRPSVVYSPTDAGGGRLLALGSDSLVESLDTGRTWRAISPLGFGMNGLLVDREVVIATGYREIARSTDSGRTWTVDSMPGAAAVLADDGDMFLASQGIVGMRESDGLYRSTDRAATWSRVVKGVVSWLATRGGNELWAGFDPHAMLSTDDGATWRRVDEGLEGRAGTLHTAGDGTIYGSIDGYHLNTGNGGYRLNELMRTDDDGRSWRSLHDSVRSVAVLLGDWGILINVATIVPGRTAGYNDIGGRMLSSTDRGETWRTHFDGTLRTIAANATGMAFATAFRGDSVASFVTTDSGATWRVIDPPYPTGFGAVTPGGSIIVGAVNYQPGGSRQQYLLRSDDSGTTWRTLDSGAGYYSWQFQPFEDGVIVAVIPRGDVDTVPRIMRSTDNGETWTTVLTGVHPWRVIRDSTALVVFAYSDPENGSVVIAHSTDSGATWAQHDAPPIASSQPTYTHGNEIFAYMEGALVRTLDHGVTWTTISSGTRFLPWHSAATNGRVMIAASDRLRRAAAPAAAPEESMRPGRLRTAGLTVTPLPARETVTIEAPGAGLLRIVDARGELVQRTTITAPGSHVIDVHGLEGGTYLVRLECANGALSGRIVVAR